MICSGGLSVDFPAKNCCCGSPASFVGPVCVALFPQGLFSRTMRWEVPDTPRHPEGQKEVANHHQNTQQRHRFCKRPFLSGHLNRAANEASRAHRGANNICRPFLLSTISLALIHRTRFACLGSCLGCWFGSDLVACSRLFDGWWSFVLSIVPMLPGSVANNAFLDCWM